MRENRFVSFKVRREKFARDTVKKFARRQSENALERGDETIIPIFGKGRRKNFKETTRERHERVMENHGKKYAREIGAREKNDGTEGTGWNNERNGISSAPRS